MRLTTLSLDDVRHTRTSAVEFVFTPSRRLRVRAGQYGIVYLPGGGAHPFTFSSDDRRDLVSIATTLESGSRYKRTLDALPRGARAFAVGALGDPPKPVEGEPEVLLAQGIGITPFLAMARSRDHLDATVLQVGTPHFFDEVSAHVTTAEHHEHRDTFDEAVDRRLAESPLAHWSLSGRSAFVRSLAGRLRRARVPAGRIHRDAFWTLRSPDAQTVSS